MMIFFYLLMDEPFQYDNQLFKHQQIACPKQHHVFVVIYHCSALTYFGAPCKSLAVAII